MSKKKFYRLSDDAIRVIESSATPHKRGDWVSAAVLAFCAFKDDAADGCTVDQRLARIEALLIASLDR